jgi:hypothetical protein
MSNPLTLPWSGDRRVVRTDFGIAGVTGIQFTASSGVVVTPYAFIALNRLR